MQDVVLTGLGEFIRKRVERIIIEQGHKLTGKIYDDVLNKVSGELLEGWYQHYGEYLERGVHKDNIPFYPGSGKKRSLYIEALIRYAEKRKMINPKSAAFAIAWTHKKEGMPTRNSGIKFSKTGQRLGWLTKALDIDIIGEYLEPKYGRNLEMDVDKIIDYERGQIKIIEN